MGVFAFCAFILFEWVAGPLAFKTGPCYIGQAGLKLPSSASPTLRWQPCVMTPGLFLFILFIHEISIYLSFCNPKVGAVETRVLYILGKCPTTELHDIPFLFSFFFSLFTLRQGLTQLPQLTPNPCSSCRNLMSNWYSRPPPPGPTQSLLPKHFSKGSVWRHCLWPTSADSLHKSHSLIFHRRRN